MQKQRVLKIILWSARLLGSFVIVFLLITTIAEIFSNSNIIAMNNSDVIALLLFPISTIIGLLIAFKRESIGGLITVGGIMVFHILRPELAASFLINSFAIPGLLYIIYAVWSKS